MGFKFRRSIKIAPGIRVNLGHSSMGVSVGGKGYRYSVNTKGRRTTTLGMPGTGISYSVSSTSGTKRKKNASTANYDKWVKEQAVQKQLERDQLVVQHYVELIADLKSLHTNWDDEIDWLGVSKLPAPFVHGSNGPNEKKAQQLLDTYKPGFLDNIMGKVDKKRLELADTVVKAREKDLEEYSDWTEMVATAKAVLTGDLDAYEKVMIDFAPLDDLSEYGSGFEVQLNDANLVEVDFVANTKDVVPTESKSLTSSGKLTTKAMTKGAYLDLCQDFVCSAILRIALDIFATLPVKDVVIHANDIRVDEATGHDECATIVSTKISRNVLYALNLEKIDPSDAMSNFKTHMSFMKTKGFKKVEKVDLT